jgi:hypothetical protein
LPAESINGHQEEDLMGNSMNDSLDLPAVALAINGGDNEPLI